MRTRDKLRLQRIVERRTAMPNILGRMRGTFKIAGDIATWEWDEAHDPANGADYRLAYGESSSNSASQSPETTHA